MRELQKIPNDIEKDTKYDIPVSEKDNGGDHNETDQPVCRENKVGKIEQIGRFIGAPENL